MLKGPNKKFDIVKVWGSGYSRYVGCMEISGLQPVQTFDILT